MPLFFILSGFFIRENVHLKENLCKSFRAYIRPYLYTCVVGAALIFSYCFMTGELRYDRVLIEYLQKTLFVQTARTTDIGPIWFLVALFWGQNILIYLKSKLTKFHLCCCVLMLALCSMMIADIIFVPFSLFQGLTALPYLYAGLLLKTNMNTLYSIVKDKYCLAIIGIMWMIYVLLGNVMRISFVVFPHGFTSYIISILSSFVILYYSKYIDSFWLRAIGRHTLLILCIHTLVLPYVKKIGLIQANAWYISIEIIVDIAISLLISLLIVKLKEKYVICKLK